MIPWDLIYQAVADGLAAATGCQVALNERAFEVPPTNGDAWYVLHPMSGGSTVGTLSDPQAIVERALGIVSGGQTAQQSILAADLAADYLMGMTGGEYTNDLVGDDWVVIGRSALYGQRGLTDTVGQTPRTIFYSEDRYLLMATPL